MIYDILEMKLQAIGLRLGARQNGIFRNQMPADCTSGVLVRAPLTGIRIDPHISGYYKTRIQVVSRSADPVALSALAQRVTDALTVEALERHPASSEHGPASIALFYPESLPIVFPRLEGNLLEASQHFLAAFSFTRAE